MPVCNSFTVYVFNLCSMLCVCVCVTCRPAGGHARRACQLQHHSERVEAFLQQGARGERPLGKSVISYILVIYDLHEVQATLKPYTPHIDKINHVKPNCGSRINSGTRLLTLKCPLDYS